MKKIIFAMLATVAVLASCSKDNTHETPAPEYPVGGGASVELTLSSDPETRAFFSETAAAEPWEKKLNTLMVYVFDPQGTLLTKQVLTPKEVAAGRGRFALTTKALGKECSFYVVANADYGYVSTLARIETLNETADYNGPFGNVSTGCARSEGFVMTGKTSAVVETSTKIAVSLKRTVAKVAVRVRIDESFAAEIGNGTLNFTAAKISKASATTLSFFAQDRYAPSIELDEIAQVPQRTETGADMLFYLYENAPLAEGDRVVVKLFGVFDADGNDATTADRSDVLYNIELAGEGDGAIRRNAYYRVEAVIKGLSSDGVVVDFSCDDWDTPDTKTVPLVVSFSDEAIGTRAYMDDVAQTNEWERRIDNVDIHVYDSNGRLVIREHRNSVSGIAPDKVVIDVPSGAASAEYSVYVTANIAIGYCQYEAALLESYGEDNQQLFNGEIGPILSGELFTQGFPMSGRTKVVIPSDGRTAKTHVTLKRLMSKIAFEYRIDPDFAQNHDGAALRIDKVYCGLAAQTARVFETEKLSDPGNKYSKWFEQEL